MHFFVSMIDECLLPALTRRRCCEVVVAWIGLLDAGRPICLAVSTALDQHARHPSHHHMF